MWALVVAGCTTTVDTGAGGAGIAACGTPTPFDATAFANLTATNWNDGGCDSGGPLPPTCNTIELDADGRYAWTAISDVVERDQHGQWNFTARDQSSGIVCLDNGAVLAFEMIAGGMRLGQLGLETGKPLTATGSREDLFPVLSDPLFPALTAHEWVKTNNFNLGTDAQQFTLARDGTFTASYRDGACTHGGVWSIDLDPRSSGPTPVLYPSSDANTCDIRGSTSAQLPAADVPRIELGRLILFCSSYRGPATAPPWFAFQGYSDDVGVETSGALDHDVSASGTTFDLDFVNRATTAKNLSSFAIRATPVMLVPQGYSGTGPAVLLASSDLSGTSLAPGDHASASLSITPPAGDTLLGSSSTTPTARRRTRLAPITSSRSPPEHTSYSELLFDLLRPRWPRSFQRSVATVARAASNRFAETPAVIARRRALISSRGPSAESVSTMY